MSKVTIYTTKMCGFCWRAKRLLDSKGVVYEEIDVTFDREGRAKMRERAGGALTVPQIFICEVHVGGSDELYALDVENKLDSLLEDCTGMSANVETDAPDAG